MSLRKSHTPQYDYLGKKINIDRKCEPHLQNNMCGVCFWEGISVRLEDIPECTVCKEDTEKFGRLVKDNPKAKTFEFEPDCFKACLWWEWFHNVRKMKCGCLCETVCVCGKIKYGEKKKVVSKKIEEEEKKKKGKK